MLLACQALASLSLMGLIWTIQIVHYPMFARLNRDRFAESLSWHGRAISWIVGPLMLLELLCAGWLLRSPGILARLGFLMVCAIWVSTGLVQAPLHGELCKGYDQGLLQRLIRTNWLRTTLWTGRGILSLHLLCR